MQLFLIGGFLGSGKTTAIHGAALALLRRGVKVGVVTNDQGAQLVDSEFIGSSGIPVREVLNGCFCCNYRHLNDSLLSLAATDQPQVVFAESVGSCTDLISTVVNPLLRFRPELRVSVTVFADARVIYPILKGLPAFFEDNVNYIYRKQLDEADILVLNKADLLPRQRLEETGALLKARYPQKTILYQNSLEEAGILQWLSVLEQFSLPAERKSLELDYDIYGAGEADLAWLDQTIEIHAGAGNAIQAGIELANRIFGMIREAALPVGHLKFLLDAGGQQRKISFTAADESFFVPGDEAPAAERIRVLINARVQTAPAVLQQLVAAAIRELEAEASCTVTLIAAAAFQPGYPRPEHRILS
jgi:Ni2+-binding GTPase involved in maturation of urease and hydrogenase